MVVGCLDVTTIPASPAQARELEPLYSAMDLKELQEFNLHVRVPNHVRRYGQGAASNGWQLPRSHPQREPGEYNQHLCSHPIRASPSMPVE